MYAFTNIFSLIYIVALLFMFYSLGVLFERAGRSKWLAFVPFVNAGVFASIGAVNPVLGLLMASPLMIILYPVLMYRFLIVFNTPTKVKIAGILLPFIVIPYMAVTDKYDFDVDMYNRLRHADAKIQRGQSAFEQSNTSSDPNVSSQEFTPAWDSGDTSVVACNCGAKISSQDVVCPHCGNNPEWT